jgi:phosphorylcholine metabolism protein LicD
MKVCSSAKNYEQVGLLSFSGFLKRFIWNKEWFNERIILPFEFIDIACPKAYDPILRTMYGNYMEFVKGSQVHTMVLCDPDTPFKKKLSEKFIR